MDRRNFLKVGAAAAPPATPAIAQDVRQWKMVTAWPKNLPRPGVAAQMLADRITTLYGWFRNEIKSIEDLKGLKFRTTGLASEMGAKLGMAAEAVSGPAMFQALQTGALDAGEFIGPWTDSALGYQQVAKYYYWPGVGEPSSAEECGVNAEAYGDLPDDLKQAVSFACESLYVPVWTEYTTKHATSLKELVDEDDVKVMMLPRDVIDAMGVAATEVIDDMRQDDDELVRRITDSFVAYRDSVGAYMTFADAGQMATWLPGVMF